MNITDPTTDKYVRELAAVTGEEVTVAVRKAVEERLARLRREKTGRNLAADLLEIGARCAALPDIDTRTPEDILSYDDHGLSR
jgi:antitoxin VapB